MFGNQPAHKGNNVMDQGSASLMTHVQPEKKNINGVWFPQTLKWYSLGYGSSTMYHGTFYLWKHLTTWYASCWGNLTSECFMESQRQKCPVSRCEFVIGEPTSSEFSIS